MTVQRRALDAAQGAAAERRRRRQELLEQRQMTVTWRNRLLSRRLKYIKARQDLARHLSSLDSGVPPSRI